MTQRISRRTVLRGVGTAVALPLLDSMLPRGRAAEAAAKAAAPRRMAFIYVPNGCHMEEWTPSKEGTDYELPPILEPLSPVKNDLLVLSGLTCDKARPNGDGAGDHARASSSFLTGAQARKTAGSDIHVGVSADQVVAQRLGSATRFPSLEIGCEGGGSSGN